ncbi:MAG: hypothetical protein VYA30_10515 [Myxococcota bacterium]|nr:hypothetical protein [Myxococcota bacterium]
MSDSKQDMENRLVELLYGELKHDEADALRQELEANAELKETYDDWNHVYAVMDELPLEEPDPAVHYEILRVARQQASADKGPGLFERFFMLLQNPAFAALGLFIIGGAVFSIFKDGLQEGDGTVLVGEMKPSALPAAKPSGRPAAKSKPPALPAAKPAARPAGKAKQVGAAAKPALQTSSEEETKARAARTPRPSRNSNRLARSPIGELDAPAAALAANAEASLELDTAIDETELGQERSYEPTKSVRSRAKKRVRKAKKAAARSVPAGQSNATAPGAAPMTGILGVKSPKQKTGTRKGSPQRFAPPPAPSASVSIPLEDGRPELAPSKEASGRGNVDSESADGLRRSSEPSSRSSRGPSVNSAKGEAGSAVLGRTDRGRSLAALAASGTQAVAGGQYRQAITIWKQYLDDGGKKLSSAQKQYAYFQLATCHHSLGQFSAARRYLIRLSGKNSPYATRAQDMLDMINKKRRASRKSRTPRIRSKKGSKSYDSKR